MNKMIMGHVRLIVCVVWTLSYASNCVRADDVLPVNVEGKALIGYQAKPLSNPAGGEQFKGSDFIHPLKTPSGFTVTCIQPDDHRHHFGVWWPWKYVEVEGRKILCWELQGGEGLIQAQESKVTENGFTATSIYIDRKAPGGPKTLINETVNATVSKITQTPAVGYFLDLEIIQEVAFTSAVTVTKYSYSGFSFRGAISWNKDNSTILTSAGTERSNSDGTAAKWVRIEGKTGEGDKTAGVVMMSRADNREHPEKLRTWNEKTLNGRVFVNFNPVREKDWIMEPGKKYTRNYRLFVYDGSVSEKQAEDLWKEYSAVKSGFVPLLYAAEGAGQIQYYNEEGSVAWQIPVEMSRDVSRLPNGNLLYAYNRNYNGARHDNPGGVIEYDPLQQKNVMEFATTGQVWSCWRLADGRTLVGAASQGRVLFLNAKGVVMGSFPVKNRAGHSCLRHVRPEPGGNILVAEESANAVREYTQEGALVREITVSFKPFSMERLTNGNTIVSGQGAMVELDADGRTVWQLKGTDYPALGIRWCAGFQLLDNGDLLVCNAGGKVPFFRVTPGQKPKVVWQSDPNAKIPLGHGVALCPRRPDMPPPVTFPLRLPGPVQEIVFCTRSASGDGHWYANFGYMANDPGCHYSGKHGRLCKLDLRTGKVETLIEDLEGAVRDPVVSYDGKRILFSWRKGSTAYFNIYECDIDGGNRRQITFGPWDDFECCYLPDGGIIFVSSRSKRWVNCMKSQVATLFRCDADGRNIRSLSGNIEHDNSPWILPDGRIIYTRWEYVDRSQMAYHHLWTMNPDGTGQMVYYGNYYPGGLFIDAKPVPDTSLVVAAVSGGHGARDHYGAIALIDAGNGPDDRDSMQYLTRSSYADPYPLATNIFLAGRTNSLVLFRTAENNAVTLFTIPDPDAQVQDPRPIVARPREPVIPARVDLRKTTGQLICQNVNIGRRMEGVMPGEIKKLLVLEQLPKPINLDGQTPPISISSTFSLERILGTVPVEEDGSSNFEVPANRSISLVALDAENRSVKRMQSFLTVMPGEVNSCIGCHENRRQSPATQAGNTVKASQRATSRIEPVPGIPEVYDFGRDIQPILDRHCLKCHDARTRSGGVELTGDRNPLYSMAYFNLMTRQQVFVGGDLAKSSYPPRTLGDSISPLMWKVMGATQDVRLVDTFTGDLAKVPRVESKLLSSHASVRLTSGEIQLLRFWINSGAVYAGTYAALGAGGGIGWMNQNGLVNNISDLASVPVARQAIERRCSGCHQDGLAVPKSPVDTLGVATYGPGYSGYAENDFRKPALSTYSRFRVFNLSRPENSLMLLAPLSKAAGGLGLCAVKPGRDTGMLFTDTKDVDYQAILAGIRDTGKRLDEITRYDRPGFIPNEHWLREMKRFGILPADLDPKVTPVDPYKTDKKYWESLWYKPDAREQWGAESAKGEGT